MKYWLLPSLMTLLALISILTLKSVAPLLATQQAIFFMIGMSVFFITSKISFQQLQSKSIILYTTTILLLIISYSYGKLTGQTGRWISIEGIINFQPSQLAIPATLLILASSKSFASNQLLIKTLIIILIPAILILIEPDLGTTIIYLFSVSTYIFVSNFSWKKIIIIILCSLISSLIAWQFLLMPYQKQRLTSFIANNDHWGASYNARQSLIAVGSGQFLGRGLGQGVQSHLRFLPERQTDFIFASLAEEFGFIGSMAIIGIYLMIISHIIATGIKSHDFSHYGYCLTIATMTAIQAGINIGMNIGIFPITGETLPLLSYGGSSILSICFMFGIVHSISTNLTPTTKLHIA